MTTDSTSFTLFPAGCLHWPIGDKELLRSWVEEVRTTPNSLALLMGDSTDIARTHYREHQRSYRADKNSQEALDTFVRAEVQKLAKVLSPVKDRLMGAILGNHYWEFLDGTNSEQYLCQLLSIPYLGPYGTIRIDLKGIGNGGSPRIVLWAHHHGGSKGGRTTGSDVSTLEKAEQTFDADIYCLSHTHRRHGFKVQKIGLTQLGTPRIIQVTKVLLRTGAFLKGFKEEIIPINAPHFPSYAEESAYRPTDLGWVKLKVEVVRVNKGGYKKLFTLTY